jgi:hypothetical protein
MEDLEELLTTPEYARERKCSERTIERERTSGAGCKYVKLGRSVRYRRRDILDFIAIRVRGSTSEPASSSPEDIVDARRALADGGGEAMSGQKDRPSLKCRCAGEASSVRIFRLGSSSTVARSRVKREHPP